MNSEVRQEKPTPRAQPRQKLRQQIQQLWQRTKIAATKNPDHTPKNKFSWIDWALGILLFTAISTLRIAWLAQQAENNQLAYHLSDWDGKNYLQIAQYGYLSPTGDGPPDPETYQRRLAFFPALPMMIRGLQHLTGWDYITVGLIICNSFGALFIIGIMALVARLGYGRGPRIFAALLALGAPMALTLNMVYTEAIFLALMAWAMLHLYNRNYTASAILIFLAGLTRLTAIDLVIAFAIMVWFCARTNKKAWALVAFSSTSIFGYLIWASSQLPSGENYFTMQAKGWGSSFDLGKSSIEWFIYGFTQSSSITQNVAALCIGIALILCVWSFERIPFAYWLTATGVVANVLLSGGYLSSRSRLLLPAVFLAIPLALAGDARIRAAIGRSPILPAGTYRTEENNGHDAMLLRDSKGTGPLGKDNSPRGHTTHEAMSRKVGQKTGQEAHEAVSRKIGHLNTKVKIRLQAFGIILVMMLWVGFSIWFGAYSLLGPEGKPL